MTQTRGLEIVSGERHPRLSLFVRSQLPVVASFAILRLVMLLFDIPVEQPVLLAVGAVGVGLITIAALVLPWERWPTRAQVVPATLDLAAFTVIAIASWRQLDTVATLAAIPAIWLAVVAGWAGAALGVLGVYTASIAPVLAHIDDVGPRQWATALVMPGVLAVTVIVARILTARHDSAARSLRRATRESLRASAESARLGVMLRSFADGVDIGLLYLDEKGESVIFNEPLLEFGRLAHYDEDAGHGLRMYGADQVTLIAPEDQPLARVRRGETLEGFVHWVGPRGAQRALLANGRPVRGSDGALAGSMIIMQDITDVLRSGREREDSLATLAHELRTPLTSIVGYTDLLLLDTLSPQATARAEIIARNAEQLLTLTSVFLDGLHREVSVKREHCALRDIVDSAIEILRTTPGFSERDLSLQIDPALRLTGDREGLAAVLTNLLGNAVKFSQPGDRIEVIGGEDDKWVSITVRNSGSHIDDEDLERIFDRFYRGGNAQRAAVAGTGIGLSVAREIVTAHGGTLTADAVDEGASFTICLPRE